MTWIQEEEDMDNTIPCQQNEIVYDYEAGNTYMGTPNMVMKRSITVPVKRRVIPPPPPIHCSWGLCKSDTRYAEMLPHQIRFLLYSKNNYQAFLHAYDTCTSII